VRRPPTFGELGGEETFRRLVAGFYARVAEDPVLRPLYPDEDLRPAAERLTLFLIQYWGGPPTYGQQRGHPRLRLRHSPFPIGVAERNAWLANMRAAMDDVGLPADLDEVVWDHLQRAAEMLRNEVE
jgi:hemoglobin